MHFTQKGVKVMSEHRDRASSHPSEDRRIVETVKALIEVYQSAFGERWSAVFIETVRVEI